VALDAARGDAEAELHARGLEALAQPRAGRIGQQAGEGTVGDVDYNGGDAAREQVVGEFAADEPGPEDGDAPYARKAVTEARVVVAVVHREHARGGVALERQANRIGAQGEHEVAPGELPAVFQPEAPRRRVDRRHGGALEHRG